MQRRLLIITTTIILLFVAPASPYMILAQGESPTPKQALSPYWHPVVKRWESRIIYYANTRDLDPDLVAAVVWKESQGNPRARSVVGAVGLMQLMPHEWRPSPKELEDPDTNLFWGVRALAQTIRDGHGDLYYSLAAFNGGWGQIHLRVTRRYATEVLDCYARAVAVRYGLPEEGDWLAVFAVEGMLAPDTITVLSPRRPLARYTERSWIQSDVPTAPVDIAPHAVVITFETEDGTQGQVNLWLVAEDGSPLTFLEAPE